MDVVVEFCEKNGELKLFRKMQKKRENNAQKRNIHIKKIKKISKHNKWLNRN